MKVFLCVAAVLSAVGSCLGAGCLNANPLEHFEMLEFKGPWYQQMFFADNESSGIYGQCVKQTYEVVSGTVPRLKITNSQKASKESTTWVTLTSYSQYKDVKNKNGLITVTATVSGQPYSIDYSVLYFISTSTAIITSCSNNSYAGYVLTRDKIPSEKTKADIKEGFKAVVQRGGPPQSRFKETSQVGC